MKNLRDLCVKLIRFYQTSISPLKPQCCRFHPVCSEYARQAFLKHGVFRGFVLSAYRILRCNPLCKHGFDPVPDELFFFDRKRKCTRPEQVRDRKSNKIVKSK